jgi:hypothetical protein
MAVTEFGSITGEIGTDILWEAFLDLSDSYFLFADLVGFYTHWTYMHIYRHIFLSNYWRQRSDIWSQASYRYPISWEAFLDQKWAYMFNVYKNQQSRQTGSMNPMGSKTLPTIWGTYMKLVTKYQISVINSCWEKGEEKCAYMFNVYKNQLKAFLNPSDSYFLFAAFVDFFIHWTYIHIFRHIFLSNYWRQRSDIWSQASYSYPISWETPNIRSLSSIVAEKKVTKNVHICSMCIKTN